MVNPICIAFRGLLEFPKLKRRICCLATKAVQLNTDFLPPFKSQPELFFIQIFQKKKNNPQVLISNKPMNAAHISIIKGQQHLSYIMRI